MPRLLELLGRVEDLWPGKEVPQPLEMGRRKEEEGGTIHFLVGQRSTMGMREFLPDGFYFLTKARGVGNT